MTIWQVSGHFRDLDEYISDIYKMVAVAARYGHQQRSEIGDMTFDQLQRLNDGLYYLIEKENETGRGLGNRGATGG